MIIDARTSVRYNYFIAILGTSSRVKVHRKTETIINGQFDIPFWLASAREAKKECMKCMWLVHVVKIKGCLTQILLQ